MTNNGIRKSESLLKRIRGCRSDSPDSMFVELFIGRFVLLLELKVNKLLIRPGNSPGIMTVDGSLYATDSVFEIELGGLLAGSEYDRIEVADVASLDGELAVHLYDLGGGAFAPSAGDAFEILSAAEIVGEFDQVTVPPLPAGLSWDLGYSATDVTLRVLSMLTGDLNGDLTVDDVDVAVWSEQFGMTGDAYSLGDGDGDGDSDGLDFLNWQREFNGQGGFSLQSGSNMQSGGNLQRGMSDMLASGGGGLSAVPEPCTLVLALAMLGVLLARPGSCRS